MTASYVEYDGTFDGVSCRGTATKARVASARALWPGVLYAFVSTDDDGKPDYLHVIGPATTWLSAAPVVPDEQLRPHVGVFSHVVVPLNHTSAVIAMSFDDHQLLDFRSLRAGGGHHPTTAYRAGDAVEPLSGRRPTSVAIRAVLDVDFEDPSGGVVRLAVQPLRRSQAVKAPWRPSRRFHRRR